MLWRIVLMKLSLSQVPGGLAADMLLAENSPGITQWWLIKKYLQSCLNVGHLWRVVLILVLSMGRTKIFVSDASYFNFFLCPLLLSSPLHRFCPPEHSPESFCMQMFISGSHPLGTWPMAVGARSTPGKKSLKWEFGTE